MKQNNKETGKTFAIHNVSNSAIIEAVTKIHSLNFKKENTLIELTEMFYGVCREFGIKQGNTSLYRRW